MTYPTPPPGRQPQQGRGRVPLRVWVIAGFIGLVVLLTATGGIRSWWAHRLHDLTNGNRTANYLIGLVIGLLPVIAVGVGLLASRGRGRFHRAWRMFAFGAVGFVATYLLSPSLSRLLTDSSSRHVFERLAPAYLAGVFTGTVVWIVVLIVAVIRARSRWRSRHTQPPSDGRSHRVIDI